MFFEKFSHDVILLLDLRLESLDLFVLRRFLSSHVMAVGLAFEDDRTFLETLLLPWSILDGMNLVLIHKRRDWNSVQKVFPDHRNLLVRRLIMAFRHSGFSLRSR